MSTRNGVLLLAACMVSMTAYPAQEARPETVGFHQAQYDAQGKLIPWKSWEDALALEMRWYLNCPENEHGFPIFVCTTFMDGDYRPYRLDNIPCTQDGMGILSYLKYWEYTGREKAKVLELAVKMGDYLLGQALTPPEGLYPSFPRSTGVCTDFPITCSSQGDAKCGPNVVEPDKGGIAGYALLKLYQAQGGKRFLDEAIHVADVLAKNMREGDAARSPWPFRVDYLSGQYWGERSGNLAYILRLFDELGAMGHEAYREPRAALWKWIKTFQFNAPEDRASSLWVQFFEDMTEVDNRNSWAPLEMARYLIERKDALDPDWKQDAEKLIQFAMKYFSKTQPCGAVTMAEQDSDMRPWGGACSKLGGVAALFYAAGGGDQYKEIAYRNLTWMVYHIDQDGCPAHMTADPKQRRGGWQEDCHTDVIHNFVDALQAVPEWRNPIETAAPLKMLAYSAAPTPYFNDHAADVARIYDGFFFVVGSWDDGASKSLGLNGEAAPWKDAVRENLKNLRAAGVTENLLGFCFTDSGAWPSPETLLSEAARARMTAQFGAIAREAKDLGFRGISVDIEYPYPRYALDNKIWTYDGYTAEDLLAAAKDQGHAATLAMLDAFPEAVIVTLPGSLRCRALGQAFLLGMLDAMAERDAPGGFHLGLERSYTLLDPVSQVAIPREGDLDLCAAVRDPKVLEYWRRRGSVAPGVWPLHMIETGGKDYPVRPWAEEMAELRQQMETLRGVAKRYIWSFSSHSIWHPHTPEIAEKYGLGKEPFPEAASVAAQWHDILADRQAVTTEPHLLKLIQDVKRFDRGPTVRAGTVRAFWRPGRLAGAGAAWESFRGARVLVSGRPAAAHRHESADSRPRRGVPLVRVSQL